MARTICLREVFLDEMCDSEESECDDSEYYTDPSTAINTWLGPTRTPKDICGDHQAGHICALETAEKCKVVVLNFLHVVYWNITCSLTPHSLRIQAFIRHRNMAAAFMSFVKACAHSVHCLESLQDYYASLSHALAHREQAFHEIYAGLGEPAIT